MTDTGSSQSTTQSDKSSHVESHTSMSGRKSRGMSHVDTSDASPQVRKSRGAREKVTPPLPREVTFSALSLGRAERDPERGEINKNTPTEPERIGPLAAKYLDHLAAQAADPDLAARQAAVLDRLRRPLTKEKQP